MTLGSGIFPARSFGQPLILGRFSSEIPTASEQADQPVSFLAIPPEEVPIQEVNGSEGTEDQSEIGILAQPEEVGPPRVIPVKNNLEAVALMNTASRDGLYLPGGQAPSAESTNGSGRGSKPSVKGVSSNDPWAAPEQKHPSEVVVEAGATIRLGGSK